MKKALLLILIFGTNLIISQNISISTDVTSFNEGETVVLTGSIDAVSESDVKIPLGISGTATSGDDFTTVFESMGSESLLSSIDSNHSHYDVLSDGRSVLLEGNNLTVYNPVTVEITAIQLSRGYNYLQVSGNTIYSIGYNSNNRHALFSIDLSDLSSISETEEITLLSDNVSFDSEFSVEGDNILYNTYDGNNDTYKIYKREGSADPGLKRDEYVCD